MSVRNIFMGVKTSGGPPPPLALPDIFYVQFKIIYDSAEISADGGLSIFNFTGVDGVNPGVLDVLPYSTGPADHYDKWQIYAQWQSGNNTDTYDVTVNPDTEYLVDLKFEFNGGHTSIDVTTKLDGSSLGVLTLTPDTAWDITEVELGNNNGSVALRSYDDFKIGTSGYGSSELMSADFASGISPFSSSEVSGSGTLDTSGGTLNIATPSSGHAYAKRLCSM